MIERRKYQLNYIKKENQSGSYQGMRFTFLKKEDALVVIAYPEPYSLAATSEEKKFLNFRRRGWMKQLNG